MDSSRKQSLIDFFEANAIGFVHGVEGPDVGVGDASLFVYDDTIAAKADGDLTSPAQMNYLARKIKDDLGITVDWVIVPGPLTLALKAALEQLLQLRFPKATWAVQMSPPRQHPALVIVEPGADSTDFPDLQAVSSVARELFQLFGLQNPEVAYLGGVDYPTSLALLRAIKVSAPISKEALAHVLWGDKAAVGEVKWLQRKLDGLRKQGLIQRSKDGMYSLTSDGLVTAPHGKYRSSSDVERALLLARKKW